mgnify:CR=1 FL=1
MTPVIALDIVLEAGNLLGGQKFKAAKVKSLKTARGQKPNLQLGPRHQQIKTDGESTSKNEWNFKSEKDES